MKINKNTDLEQQAFKRRLNQMRRFYDGLVGCQEVTVAIDTLIFWLNIRTASFKKKVISQRKRKVKQ